MSAASWVTCKDSAEQDHLDANTISGNSWRARYSILLVIHSHIAYQHDNTVHMLTGMYEPFSKHDRYRFYHGLHALPEMSPVEHVCDYILDSD
ncbi:hypothetical protein TNCV_2852441 [Trichonephila clavipes]|nr:hypothetical protein TNCV_2852441 [Trichonephila clavipes]